MTEPLVSEDLFQRMFRKHSSIMLLIDPASGIITDANLAACVYYGYPEQTLRGMNIRQINTQPWDDVHGEMKRALEEQRNYFVFVHRLAGGELRTVEVHSSGIDFKGKTLLFSIVFDVTDRKRAEELMRLASLVYRTSGEAMSVVDADGIIITVNPAFTEITGYTQGEAIGSSITMLNSPGREPAEYDNLRTALDRTGRWQGELGLRRKTGEDFLCWMSVNTVFNNDGSVQSRVALFSDITKAKESDELIWRQANYDALTCLPNRSMFLDRLTQTLKIAQRSGQHAALLFIDLDTFKEVNDTLGHSAGDRLLQSVAQRLRACVRESDTVARAGSDEFAVILGELRNTHGVERTLQVILHALAEPYHIGGEQVFITASIGVTFYPEDGAEAEVLLKNSDQAMYAAKAQGRNRYSYFTSSMQELAQARKRLISDLRVALIEKQFCVFYQPIMDLATGTIHKAEALVRWQHPERGLVSPGEFIPVTEETGMITELGDWLFHQVARQAAAWRSRYHPAFQISINVSPVQFREPGIDNAGWLRHLEALNLPGQSVVVEITEGLLMDAAPQVTQQLLAFRDRGVQVALDDFGTGYSSLAYLKKFDIDYLKIDQAFVR
ncbi:MAG TPA: diguanylate cyclase, partial [Noviherbaspirillum sp.]|nr:diguanylate cyclase [Noviherbaspirillum sp.]